MDAGSVKNTATSTGKPPSGANVTGASPQSTVATAAAAPSVALTKSGLLAPGASAGSTVAYSFSLKNSGNVTLTGVTISDPLVGLSALTYTWPGTAGALTPGQTVTATATYVLKQSDVDAGSVANTATGSGTPPTGANVTQSQSATVPVSSAPALLVTKAGLINAPGTGTAGNVITYSVSARNTGNVTLTGVTIADTFPGLSALSYAWPGTAGTLTPGQTVSATATYTITQADVDAGSVKNTATATGKPPTGANVTASSPQSTVATVVPAPAILTSKSAARAGTGAVGDVITYSFTSKNTGNVTLTGVAISDPLVGLSAINYGAWPSGTAGTLAPGQTVTATATYTIKQSDVDAGSVKNTASSTGKPPTGATVTASSALVTTGTAAAAPSVALTKSGLLAPGATAGSTVAYSFSMKNSGNVTLTGVTISDPLVGLSALTYTWPGTAGALTPGQTVTATATYVLKQSDVDAGSVANTATGSGTPPTGANVTQSQSATVPVSSAPALLVTKAGLINAPGTGTAGNVITYSVSARNTGNVTLTGVTIADTFPGLSALSYAWPGTAGTLTPGQTVSATATYTITQADVDAGSVKNTATATGKPPTGANVTASSPQSTVATVVPAPAILTSKSAARAGTGAVGDVITYSFTSKNTGNVTLTGVAISDPLVGLSAINYGAWPSGTAGTLSPGETVSATATYTITQADVDAGSVKNTATGSGTPPSGAPVTSLPPQVTTSTAASAPATVLTKTGALAGSPVAGSTVTYSFTLRNSGNVTLTAAGISDPLPGLSALTYSGPGPVGRLLPGQTATATATYVVTQADVDAGSIANTSSSTAKPPTGANVASTAPATVALASAASVGVTKTGTITAPGTGLAGDTIAYSFTVSNTGNVTLAGVIITDSKPGVTIPVVSWPGTAGTLVPGQSATGTATYTITQSDVDAGSVRNTATTSGKPPTGATVQATSTPSVVATATATPSITTTKAGVIASGETGVAGDSVQYSFQSTNSGNVTLTGVTISDPKPGLSAIVYRTWPSGTVGTLAPGQSITATASYLLTQADVDAGSVSNTASSSGTPPTGAPVSDASPTTIVQTAASAPSTVFSKTGTLAAGSTGSAGDTVNYSFGLRNSGNVTLTGVSIADPLPGISALAYIWPGTAGTLLPDQTVTATATFLLTQADVDAGAVSNTASSTATPPAGAAVTRTSSATVPIVGGPAIEATKTGAITAPGTGLAGDSIAYSFIIRNAGNVTLAGVTLRDSKLGVSTPVIIWPGATGRLAPGQTATATATYTVTQADVDAGSVTNTATTSGTPPTGAPVSALSAPSVVVLAAPAPAITTTKSGTISGSGAVGDTITWALSARNSGDVTLTGVSIADTLPGLSALTYSWPSAAGTLAPGQTVSASGTYLITQADVDAGSVANTATTVGTPPSGPAVSGASPRAVVATTDAAPSVLVQKSGALAGGSTGRSGDVVNYTFSITNSGNVTLRGVALADPLPGLSALAYTWSAAPGTLAPGQRATAAATYTLTQADVDAGSVANTVTGSGTPPSGGAATGTAPATVPVPRVPPRGHQVRCHRGPGHWPCWRPRRLHLRHHQYGQCHRIGDHPRRLQARRVGAGHHLAGGHGNARAGTGRVRNGQLYAHPGRCRCWPRAQHGHDERPCSRRRDRHRSLSSLPKPPAPRSRRRSPARSSRREREPSVTSSATPSRPRTRETSPSPA